MNRIWFVLIPFIFMLSCGEKPTNFQFFCFSKLLSNLCSDNEGGSTTTVTDKSTDEVINEQKSQSGFKDELEVTNILKERVLI